MNDEELEEVLRRTLRNRAAAMRPGRPTSEIPVTVVRQIRRPPAALAALAAAAAVIAVTVGIIIGTSGGGHHQGLSIVTSPSSSSPSSTTATTLAPSNVVTPTSVAPTPTTVAPAPVPADFDPRSVTFVSSRSGWVLGTTPCGPGQCFSLARTTDSGDHWYTANSAVTLPGLTVGTSPESVQVRFANLADGWIFTPTQLWSTHDGGDVWGAVATPGGSQALIQDLEAANGVAYLVTVATSPALYSAPVSTDRWTPVPVTLTQGAGPADSDQIVLSGTSGWVIDIDRTTIGGARMVAGQWSAWTPPCSDATGPGVLAAAGPTELTAMCYEGDWGTPAPGTTPGEWLFSSSDAGNSFNRVGQMPGTNDRFLAVAAGNPLDILVSTSAGIVGSFDGGVSWNPVKSISATQQVEFLGYTTATQAVAIVANQDGSGASLDMSRDGGHSWTAVNL